MRKPMRLTSNQGGGGVQRWTSPDIKDVGTRSFFKPQKAPFLFFLLNNHFFNSSNGLVPPWYVVAPFTFFLPSFRIVTHDIDKISSFYLPFTSQQHQAISLIDIIHQSNMHFTKIFVPLFALALTVAAIPVPTNEHGHSSSTDTTHSGTTHNSGTTAGTSQSIHDQHHQQQQAAAAQAANAAQVGGGHGAQHFIPAHNANPNNIPLAPLNPQGQGQHGQHGGGGDGRTCNCMGSSCGCKIMKRGLEVTLYTRSPVHLEHLAHAVESFL
ncbi:hypothetical protein FRC16_010382 [Serendipita sp. 398]|nr:hypothetical protein FRC16_010382 [Serendipita sp. 398]